MTPRVCAVLIGALGILAVRLSISLVRHLDAYLTALWQQG